MASQSWRIVPSESVTARLNLRRITSGSSSMSSLPSSLESDEVDILRARLLEVADARRGRRNGRLRRREQLAVARVEALRDVPGELQMLSLVLTHRDAIGEVEEDVGGLQHGVGEEPDGDRLGARPLSP